MTTVVKHTDDSIGNEYHEPAESEVIARLDKFLASVRHSTRAVDDLATPLSKAIAKRAQFSLRRLASLPNDANRLKVDELTELTRSLVRKLARRLELDREKLLSVDPDEWEVALDGEPGGRHGTLTAGLAAFADSLVMPARDPMPSNTKRKPTRPKLSRDAEFERLSNNGKSSKEIAVEWNRKHPHDSVSDATVRTAISRLRYKS